MTVNNRRSHRFHEILQTMSVDSEQIPVHVVDKFIEMFDLIQEPFNRVTTELHRIGRRRLFLSYNYILVKFCELLDLHEYKNLFRVNKNRLRQQDEIFAGMCDLLGWKFVPSM